MRKFCQENSICVTKNFVFLFLTTHFIPSYPFFLISSVIKTYISKYIYSTKVARLVGLTAKACCGSNDNSGWSVESTTASGKKLEGKGSS